MDSQNPMGQIPQTNSQIPQESGRSKKFLITLIIALVVIIVAGGVWAFRDKIFGGMKATPTPSQQANTYTNEKYGYSFNYPDKWSAVTSQYNPGTALFGPDATSSNGIGGVERMGELSSGQTLKDFVSKFYQGLEGGASSENESTINGQSVIISIVPKAGAGDTKSVAFLNGSDVFNVYLTNYSRWDANGLFEEILNSFKFIKQQTNLNYTNNQYGFALTFQQDWQGYSILNQQWEGRTTDGTNRFIESGPKIIFRHPKWAEKAHYEDIPIMVFTLNQWNEVSKGEIYVSAAPIGPSLLAKNLQYVFALPPRYNYDYATGWQEADQIVHTLKAIAPSQFCGGIAGIKCSAGYTCKLDGNYPDAGGICVKN